MRGFTGKKYFYWLGNSDYRNNRHERGGDFSTEWANKAYMAGFWDAHLNINVRVDNSGCELSKAFISASRSAKELIESLGKIPISEICSEAEL